MGLFNRVVQGWSAPQVAAAVEAVVRRSTGQVVDRIGRTPLAMPSAEARGYIRALAIAAVRRELEAALEEEYAALQTRQAELLSASLEQVTAAVLKHCREQLRTRFILRQAA